MATPVQRKQHQLDKLRSLRQTDIKSTGSVAGQLCCPHVATLSDDVTKLRADLKRCKFQLGELTKSMEHQTSLNGFLLDSIRRAQDAHGHSAAVIRALAKLSLDSAMAVAGTRQQKPRSRGRYHSPIGRRVAERILANAANPATAQGASAAMAIAAVQLAPLQPQPLLPLPLPSQPLSPPPLRLSPLAGTAAPGIPLKDKPAIQAELSATALRLLPLPPSRYPTASVAAGSTAAGH